MTLALILAFCFCRKSDGNLLTFLCLCREGGGNLFLCLCHWNSKVGRAYRAFSFTLDSFAELRRFFSHRLLGGSLLLLIVLRLSIGRGRINPRTVIDAPALVVVVVLFIVVVIPVEGVVIFGVELMKDSARCSSSLDDFHAIHFRHVIVDNGKTQAFGAKPL